ncbi:hypothetical protein TWF730_005901 [Orbilia blumenaviensis]|uniref:UV-endonuclease UvdE n=1 Tax=Orbilia blumenaviensis TaxID=1796055 RepID=A0AAV9VJQ9_9PEZI
MLWRYKGPACDTSLLSFSAFLMTPRLISQSRTLPRLVSITTVSNYTTSQYRNMPRSRKTIETLSSPAAMNGAPPSVRRSARTLSSKANYTVDLPSPPDSDIIDGKTSLRASPTAIEDDDFSPGFMQIDEDELAGERIKSTGRTKPKKVVEKVSRAKQPPGRKRKATKVLVDDGSFSPEMAGSDEELRNRPPAVNDEYRPVPFKGRLGFACLNTYLRSANPPVFCSRTCRLDTIHKHDTESGPGGGLAYVKTLGFQNATDLGHLIRWNEKYNIKFLRISSEMFPFASHSKYGYDLEHAAEPLKEAGRLAMKYGHRLTMHPGQYTQLASPREEVIDNAIRDLNYHCELLDRLQLIGQADKDAVMIIHMGGTFGDKAATLDRFRTVYTTRLSESVKARLVLENDDVCWSVEDLIDICEELGIPLVLDWHHNNIVHGKLREGTYDVKEVYGERIKDTWVKKGIKQKQHYSEPRAGSITDRDRRRHSPRVWDLPPCENDMDLMIEAKDKEQAVFEVMRKFRLDGWEGIKDVIPHERTDQQSEDGNSDVHEISMGGAEGRVYWPEGMEESLKPKKRARAKKSEAQSDGEKSGARRRTSKKVKLEEKEETPLKKVSRKASKNNLAAVEVKLEKEQEDCDDGLDLKPVAIIVEDAAKPARTKRAKKTVEVAISKVTETVKMTGKQRSSRTK